MHCSTTNTIFFYILDSSDLFLPNTGSNYRQTAPSHHVDIQENYLIYGVIKIHCLTQTMDSLLAEVLFQTHPELRQLGFYFGGHLLMRPH